MPQLAYVPDAIMAFVVVEFIGLVWWRGKRGTGPSPLDIAANLAAGACLLLALRAALLGQETMLLAALAASGLAHVADLARRWK